MGGRAGAFGAKCESVGGKTSLRRLERDVVKRVKPTAHRSTHLQRVGRLLERSEKVLSTRGGRYREEGDGPAFVDRLSVHHDRLGHLSTFRSFG